MADPRDLELPPAMVQHALEFQGPPAPVRPAATVVLLRPAGPAETGPQTAARQGAAAGEAAGQAAVGEAAAGQAAAAGAADRQSGPDRAFEVYVIRRVSTMAFGGIYAFPGGGVDPADRPETLREDWPELLGVPDERARAVVGAAARELFEETGVLLAGRAYEPDHTVGDVTGDDWEADRTLVAGRQLTMAELLKRRGLRLRDDLLLPWARWITPEFEPRRYDTWFFVALLPEAQTARDVSGEADRTAWISPAAADGLATLPPTRAMLNDLGAYRRIDDVVAGSRHRNAAAPVMPRIESAGDGGVILHVPRPPSR